MSNLPAVEATKRAVRDTRTRVLLSKTKMTSIAEVCGRNRMTVAKWLEWRRHRLAAFLAAQQLSGGDPLKHSPTHSTPKTLFQRSAKKCAE